jgi:hypothetical protein
MSPDEIIGQLRQLALSAPREALLPLAAECAAFLEIAHLRSLKTEQVPGAETAPEGNISVKEAARRLGVSDSFIRKKEKTLPFVLRSEGRILVDPAALARYQRQRLAAGKTGGASAR